MKRRQDPSHGTRRQYRWVFLVGVLLWIGFVAGGAVWAYAPPGGTGTFVKRISCTQGEVCYYDTGHCNSQYVALANNCTSSGGGGGGGGTFCWAQPSGGHNATVNGNPGYLASCAPANTCNGKSGWVFGACTGAYTGTWNNYHCGSIIQTHSGNAPSGQCVPQTAACTGQSGWVFAGCTGAYTGTWDNYHCGSVIQSNSGNAPAGRCVPSSATSTSPTNTGSGSSSTSTTTTPTSTAPAPAPSCTPSSSTSYGGTSWNGCASKGVESGTQSYTVYHSCPSYTSNGSRTLTQSTSTTCQSVVEHQCAYAKPGYAQSETCLTSPLGGTTNCSGWSTPYYDPHDCPIPTPVN